MRRLTTLGACVAVVAVPLAGCGDKEPGIAKRDASELVRQLRRVQALSDDPQRCDDLAAAIDNVRVKVRGLPSKVDADVRESLRNGVKNLAESAQAQCEDTKTTPTETTPTETTPTEPTAPPPSETTPPPTTPPPTTPPPTTPPPTTPPPTNIPPVPTTPGTGGQGPGNGNGNGQGQGKVKGKKKDKGPGNPHGHGGKRK